MGMSGRPLNDLEVAAYDVLPAALARSVRVHQVRRLPGGYAGLTLRLRVLLAQPVPDDGSSSLLAHELVHVRQWIDQGAVGFAWTYVSSFVVNLLRVRSWQGAYRAIEAEAEARRETTDWLRRRARDHQG